MRSQICSTCGQEVRFGVREGWGPMWLHKNNTDHPATLGYLMSGEDWEEIERQLDLPRERQVPMDPPFPLLFRIEEYTTREYDLARYRKSKKFRLAEEQDSDEEFVFVELPPVEVPQSDVDPASLPPRSGLKQVCNLVLKASGWELVRLTHSRGPYIGASGEVLSISDRHVMSARNRLDDRVLVAVGSWRDGKFDSAYTGTIRDGRLVTEKVDATTLKGWIKQ